MAQHISTKELKEKLDSGGEFVLVNALDEKSFEKRHIPGSINVPNSEVRKKAPKKLEDKDKETIVYCASRSCDASTKAAEKLEDMGYTNVVEFDAGIAGWEEEGHDFEGLKA